MKLISMTDFVLEQNKDLSLKHSFRQCINYAMFLKQPLTLGMFIPCDENGKVLNKRYKDNHTDYYSGKWQLYENAREKVLFNGFEIKNGFLIAEENSFSHIFWNSEGIWKLSNGIKTIEDLILYNLDLSVSF